MPPRQHKVTSIRKNIFIFLLLIMLLMLAGMGYYAITNATKEGELTKVNAHIGGLQQQIDRIEEQPGYNKLALVKQLLSDTRRMPRSTYIPLLIDMLQELQAVDSNTRDRIELSDFRINLEEIELQGIVSRLLLLYYSSSERGFVGLIDRFRMLPFLQDIRIQTYKKDSKEGDFSFSLYANVVLEDDE